MKYMYMYMYMHACFHMDGRLWLGWCLGLWPTLALGCPHVKSTKACPNSPLITLTPHTTSFSSFPLQTHTHTDTCTHTRTCTYTHVTLANTHPFMDTYSHTHLYSVLLSTALSILTLSLLPTCTSLSLPLSQSLSHSLLPSLTSVDQVSSWRDQRHQTRECLTEESWRDTGMQVDIHNIRPKKCQKDNSNTVQDPSQSLLNASGGNQTHDLILGTYSYRGGHCHSPSLCLHFPS